MIQHFVWCSKRSKDDGIGGLYLYRVSIKCYNNSCKSDLSSPDILRFQNTLTLHSQLPPLPPTQLLQPLPQHRPHPIPRGPPRPPLHKNMHHPPHRLDPLHALLPNPNLVRDARPAELVDAQPRLGDGREGERGEEVGVGGGDEAVLGGGAGGLAAVFGEVGVYY